MRLDFFFVLCNGVECLFECYVIISNEKIVRFGLLDSPSVLQVFYQQAERWQSRPLVYGKQGHHWRPLTWSQVALRARSIASGLVSLGIEAKSRVAIWSVSGPEWVLADLGTQSAGLINVPIYEGCSDDELVYILRDSQCEGIFIKGTQKLERLASLSEHLPDLQWVVTLGYLTEPKQNDSHHHVSHSFLLSSFPLPPLKKISSRPNLRLKKARDLLQQHQEKQTDHFTDDYQYQTLPHHHFVLVRLNELEQLSHYDETEEEIQETTEIVNQRIAAIQSDDLMTIQYTSGTTGEPKGVMLSHRNIISNCQGCIQAIPVTPNDRLLSFLPLSHSFERLAGYYMPTLFGGAQIYFAEGSKQFIRNMSEVSPTIITGIPRIYEKIYARFRGYRGKGWGKKSFNQWVLQLGQKVNQAHKNGQKINFTVQKQLDFARQYIFKDLRERLGGNIRIMVSGGAPLAEEVAEFFHVAGLLILEGYGLSETSPVLSVNRPNEYRFGSVGKPLFNVKIKCDHDFEILVKGDHVSCGYWNKPIDTESLFTEDHWLRTGDIGQFDKDGFLYITDRKKDLFKTANGKQIAPQFIERLLNSSPFIEQSYVVGERRPYCVALIVPSQSQITLWASNQGITLAGEERATWFSSPVVKAKIEDEIQRLNGKLATHETIKKFHLLASSFVVEHLTTQSLKLKRNAVMQAYLPEIDSLYGYKV